MFKAASDNSYDELICRYYKKETRFNLKALASCFLLRWNCSFWNVSYQVASYFFPYKLTLHSSQPQIFFNLFSRKLNSGSWPLFNRRYPVVPKQWRIQGRGPRGPIPPYFKPKLRPEGPKKICLEIAPPPPPPPYLRVWMTGPSLLPTYLKV